MAEGTENMPHKTEREGAQYHTKDPYLRICRVEDLSLYIYIYRGSIASSHHLVDGAGCERNNSSNNSHIDIPAMVLLFNNMQQQ